MQKLRKVIVIFQFLFLFSFCCNISISIGSGIEKGRWLINTGLDLNGTYTSNTYLDETNEKSDFITSISPDLSLNFAIAPRNYLTMQYSGTFEQHSSIDNYKTYIQEGDFSYRGATKKGSELIIGTSIESNAIQPFSITDPTKDYLLRKLYGELAIELGNQTEIGARCSFDNREFESSAFSSDNYQTNTFSLSQLYRQYSKFPFLVEYRLTANSNDKQNNINTDYNSHTLFLGSRWQPGGKLSGVLRVGYTLVDFENTNTSDLWDYAIESNIVYMITEKTSLGLSGSRKILHPTKSSRDIGDYFISTKVGLSALQQIRNKVSANLAVTYQSTDFRVLRNNESIRKDELLKISLLLDWQIKSWFSCGLTASHQTNDSNIDPNDYGEFLISLGLAIRY